MSTKLNGTPALARRPQEAAQQVSREMPLLPESSPVTKYVQQLGQKLASKAPGVAAGEASDPSSPERLARFHELAREGGATRPFEGKFESWTYTPIYDTGVVASVIRRVLHLETKS